MRAGSVGDRSDTYSGRRRSRLAHVFAAYLCAVAAITARNNMPNRNHAAQVMPMQPRTRRITGTEVMRDSARQLPAPPKPMAMGMMPPSAGSNANRKSGSAN